MWSSPFKEEEQLEELLLVLPEACVGVAVLLDKESLELCVRTEMSLLCPLSVGVADSTEK